MLTIVLSRFLLESFESITETSLDQVEINRDTDGLNNVHAALISARPEAAEITFDVLWKTIEDSPRRLGIARCIEVGLEKSIRCALVVRIHGESSQFSTLCILPQTHWLVSVSNFD